MQLYELLSKYEAAYSGTDHQQIQLLQQQQQHQLQQQPEALNYSAQYEAYREQQATSNYYADTNTPSTMAQYSLTGNLPNSAADPSLLLHQQDLQLQLQHLQQQHDSSQYRNAGSSFELDNRYQ